MTWTRSHPRRGGRNARSSAGTRSARTCAKRLLRRAALALSLGGGALAAALLLRPCSSTPESLPAQAQVSLTTTRSGAQKRGEPTVGEAIVGDELVAKARVGGKHTELRIYRGTTPIARCPGDPRCRNRAPHLEITLKLTEEGTYRAVAFSGPTPIPAPGPNGLDSDVLGAQNTGVEVSRSATIVVHR